MRRRLVDYTGIDFPTPIRQINRLEAQNDFLAINVYGREKNKVVVYRISEKEKSIPRINLMLLLRVRRNTALLLCEKVECFVV